ncbi:heme-binding protein [Vibrio mediterranei]
MRPSHQSRSYYHGQYNASKLRKFEHQAHHDAKKYCAHDGSFPIRIKGSGLVGAITVSGLPQADDHSLIVNTLRGYFAED